MTAQIYPLVFKPGIKRDGTNFQGEYCTEGEWVRFQKGVVRKIGGMKAIPMKADISPTASDIMILPETADRLWMYVVNNLLLLKEIVVDRNFKVVKEIDIANFNHNGVGNFTTQSITIINKTVLNILWLTIPTSLSDIEYSGKCRLFVVKNPFDAPVNSRENSIVQTGADGGMLFSNPYLFFYGSNGSVKWSTRTNPLKFKDDPNDPTDPAGGDRGSGSQTISTDKVIYGANVRGGPVSPVLLFWTLSSVVRLSNTASDEEGRLIFAKDTISQSSSIISSRCVVEYDGLFFWIGTDRFYLYNGVVSEMANVMNFNYFFDNVDMQQRQSIFGIKNTHYGEIWWFYPVRGTPGNSRAIIYNKRENTWYDTPISRSCGTFCEANGIMYSCGRQLAPTNPVDVQNYIWGHEQEYVQTNANGSTTPIASSFSTPVFSWASFNPLKQPTGTDRWTFLKRIEPDFVTRDKSADIALIVRTKQYAQDAWVPSPVIIFNGETGKIDTMIQGRQMSFTFLTTTFFEMGHNMLLLGIGDAQ